MPRRHQKDKIIEIYRSSLGNWPRLMLPLKRPFRREEYYDKVKDNSRSLGQRDEGKGLELLRTKKYESALKKFKEAKHLDLHLRMLQSKLHPQ